MNVASLELSKELYELSGWSDTHAFWNGSDVQFDGEATWGDVHHPDYSIRQDDPQKAELYDDYPAYDLGYLLRKLPLKVKDVYWFLLSPVDAKNREWEANYYRYSDDKNALPFSNASTPEDAVCKLAIELFKQGVLTRE